MCRCNHKHGFGLDEIAQRAGKLLEEIKRNHPHLVLRFSGEDAFRTSEADLCRVYDAVARMRGSLWHT